jgi:hypothetical protein
MANGAVMSSFPTCTKDSGEVNADKDWQVRILEAIAGDALVSLPCFPVTPSLGAVVTRTAS